MTTLPPNRIHVTVQAFENDAEVQVLEYAISTRPDGEERSRAYALGQALKAVERKFPTIYPDVS